MSLADLCGDKPDNPWIDYSKADIGRIQKDIDATGLSIVRGLVRTENLDAMRDFWIEKFSTTKAAGRVTWNPWLGQENHLGFSDDGIQQLYRACDFLWNEPIHKATREVCVRMNMLRNLVLGKDASFGLRFEDSRYGIFVTASYYPPVKGWMDMHADTVDKQAKLIHCLAPITFKGRDYKAGGMRVVDRAGRTLDVDAQLTPGDAVFYDGALSHGVDKIVPMDGRTVGRLQTFPIPTAFARAETSTQALDGIPFLRFVKAKVLMGNNKLRAKLGLKPSMR